MVFEKIARKEEGIKNNLPQPTLFNWLCISLPIRSGQQVR